MKTLILGGVRSGKSRLAETLALRRGLPVTYIATALPGDEEMRQRIEAHRQRRPAGWQVVEEPYALASALRTHAAAGHCVIVDCLTLWLTQLLCAAEEGLERERDALIEVLPTLEAEIILVSNETGLGIVPLDALSRRFNDEAGRLHQALAEHCEHVVFTVAGLPMVLKGNAVSETPHWLRAPAAAPNEAAGRAGERRQLQLTKPPASLGQIERLAIRLAALQGTSEPAVDRVHIAVFAADHGVAAEQVSAFPQSVTGEMVRNFARGGAAINVLAREIGATLEVINLGTVNDTGPLAGVIDCRLGPGTANITRASAMRPEQCTRALQAGREAAERAHRAGAQLFIGGEMGIGNTTAATAMACAFLDLPPEDLAGPGTGLDPAGVARKVEVIRRALALHQAYIADPIEALRRLGGFEIAALAGSYLACAQLGLPVLVDGFIASVAALAVERLCERAREWFLFAHTSAEPGHRRVLEALNGQPLLDLRMRLGEGSGAALAVPLLRLACALHSKMATFADAGISGKVR